MKIKYQYQQNKRGKVRKYPKFDFLNSSIDVIDNVTYVGIVFNYNGKFGKAKKMFLIKAVELCFHFKKNLVLNLLVDL